MTADPNIADLNAYRDPEPEGGRRRRGKKRRRPTDWLNDRREGRGERALVPDAEVSPHDSYYGRRVVKAPPWGPQIPTYLFFGGLAGGSQLLATGAYLTGNKPLQRVTRLTSAVAVGASTVCLIEDLGRPERFYNMMRVAKLSSPMSVGTWILSGYATGAMPLAALEIVKMVSAKASGGAGEVASVAGRALAAAEAPSVGLAAACAGPLASYTAVLLSNTAMPTWAAGYRHLPFVFAGSASAASGGNAMLWTPPSAAKPARILALIGAVVDLAAVHQLEKHLEDEGVAEPLRQGAAGMLNRASLTLNVAGVALTLAAGRTRAGATLAGAAFVTASAATRFAVFKAGMASADDPKCTIDPQRQRLAGRGGRGNITTGPSVSVAPGLDAGRRRPMPGVDGVHEGLA